MSLVLYNPLQGTRAQIPELPQYWIQVHESASTASVVSGAFTYALSHMLGTTATRVASSTISIVGLLMAQGVRYIASDAAGDKVYRGANTAANLVTTTGTTATHVVSAMSSTATAATVGSTFLVGKMLHQLYMGFRQREDTENIPSEVTSDGKEADFIIYDVTPKQESTNSSVSSLYPELAGRTEMPPPPSSPLPTNETTVPSLPVKPATTGTSHKRKPGS